MKIPTRIASVVIKNVTNDEIKNRVGDNVVTVLKAALSLGDSYQVAMLCGLLIGSLPFEDFMKIQELVNADETVKQIMVNTLAYMQG